MSAKNNILQRLRSASTPFSHVPPIQERLHVVPVDADANLIELFATNAQALSAKVYVIVDQAEAVQIILNLIGKDERILAWDFTHIPLVSLPTTLADKQITVADARDGNVRVGVTGVDAALAATGSIVISAREGRPRSVSLLPYVHIAVIKESQLLPDLEAWLTRQASAQADFRDVGNHVIITGASRTADIAMELVLGAHGPAELHLIVLKD